MLLFLPQLIVAQIEAPQVYECRDCVGQTVQTIVVQVKGGQMRHAPHGRRKVPDLTRDLQLHPTGVLPIGQLILRQKGAKKH